MMTFCLDPKDCQDSMSPALQAQSDTPRDYMVSHTGLPLQENVTISGRMSRGGH